MKILRGLLTTIILLSGFMTLACAGELGARGCLGVGTRCKYSERPGQCCRDEGDGDGGY